MYTDENKTNECVGTYNVSSNLIGWNELQKRLASHTCLSPQAQFILHLNENLDETLRSSTSINC